MSDEKETMNVAGFVLERDREGDFVFGSGGDGEPNIWLNQEGSEWVGGFNAWDRVEGGIELSTRGFPTRDRAHVALEWLFARARERFAAPGAKAPDAPPVDRERVMLRDLCGACDDCGRWTCEHVDETVNALRSCIWELRGELKKLRPEPTPLPDSLEVDGIEVPRCNSFRYETEPGSLPLIIIEQSERGADWSGSFRQSFSSASITAITPQEVAETLTQCSVAMRAGGRS